MNLYFVYIGGNYGLYAYVVRATSNEQAINLANAYDDEDIPWGESDFVVRQLGVDGEAGVIAGVRYQE